MAEKVIWKKYKGGPTTEWHEKIEEFKPQRDTPVFFFKDQSYALVPLEQTSEYGPDTHVGFVTLDQQGRPGATDSEDRTCGLYIADVFQKMFPGITPESCRPHEDIYTDRSREDTD